MRGLRPRALRGRPLGRGVPRHLLRERISGGLARPGGGVAAAEEVGQAGLGVRYALVESPKIRLSLSYWALFVWALFVWGVGGE